MNGCRWELKLDGKNIDLGTGSDQELDLALKSKLKDLEFLIKKGTSLVTLFSLSDKQIADEKIKNIADTLKSSQIEVVRNAVDPAETESYYVVPNSIGVTKALTMLGQNGTTFVPQFNQEAWVKNAIDSYMHGGKVTSDGSILKAKNKNGEVINTLADPSVSTEEEARAKATEIVDTEVKSWKRLTEIGTAVHKIFEEVLSGESVTTPDPDLVPPLVFEAFKRQAIDFKASIETKYPGCSIYTEMGIKSKFITPEWEEQLKAAGATSINGIIDLLVIDANGVAHLYDYKVSRKSVGKTNDRSVQEWWKEESNAMLHDFDFWHTTKKMGAEFQLAMYAEMLRQYGFKVDSTANIVPVKMDLEYKEDGFTVDRVVAGRMYTGEDIVKVDVSISGKRGSMVHSMFHEPPTINLESESAIAKIHSFLFPANNTMTRMSTQRSDREWYKKETNGVVTSLKRTDPHYNEGKRYLFNPKGVSSMKAKYCSTEEELDTLLDKYIAKLQEERSDLCVNTANKLAKVKTDDDYSFDAFLADLNVPESQVKFFDLQFRRYADPSWEFIPNEDLNSFGIFIFKKDGKAEVVMATTSPLRTTVNLGMGTSLLGKNTKDLYADKLKVLPAMTGYMELMRGLLYVGLNSDVFSDCKIAEMRVIDMKGGDEVIVDNDTLLDNYQQLRLKNRDADMPKLDSSIFMNSVQAAAWCGLDRASSVAGLSTDYFGLNGNNADKTYWTKEYIKTALERLKRDAHLNDWGADPHWENTDAWIAYKKLYDAYIYLHGFSTMIETDIESWKTSKSLLDINGLMISSPQYSPSANIRSLAKVIDQYSKEVHRDVLQMGQPMALLFREFYDKFGNGTKGFLALFERDASGNIDPRFLLKDPESNEIKNDPVAHKLVKMLLDNLAKLKNPDMSEAELEAYRMTEEYREVPLLEAKISRQVKGLGIKQAFKNKIAEVANITEGMFAGEGASDDEVDFGGDVSSYVDKHNKMFNKFSLSSHARQDRITKYGIGMFETNLELVFNNALVAYTKANVGTKYLPIINGMRIGLMYDNKYAGTKSQNMESIQKHFDQIVKSKFFGESIVEGKHLRELQKAMNVLKSVLTTMTLSLNMKSLARESLQGIYTGISRTAMGYIPGLNGKIYADALWYVTKESPKNFSGVAMLQQLNMQYGMANQSLSQLAEGRRTNWCSPINMGKDTLFLTATAPDFMHRMSILVAKMMTDKCWSAHSVDAEGNLVYDWNKDERFAVYRSGDTSNPEYMKQRSLYLYYIDAFNKENFGDLDESHLSQSQKDLLAKKNTKFLKEGDALPQAYTMQEGQSIKNIADILYGHYDDESRSLLCDTFLGSFFMQYKTYITAKVEQ